MKRAKRVNWKDYKFHCSCLPTLMTNSKKKSEILSETAKGFLRELWIREKYGRENYATANKYTEKGLLVEQDSLDIVTKVLGQGFLAKNKETLENDYIIGTPDVNYPFLLDIKSSWDIWTFAAVDSDKAAKTYGWQMFGYMWLTGRKRSKLAYALVDTPEEIKESELYRLTYKMLTPEDLKKAEMNYEFGDIPDKKRVKVYNLRFNKDRINDLTTILDEAREYLSKIKL